MEKLKIALPICLTIIYTVVILLAPQLLKNTKLISISKYEYLNFQFHYQFILIVVSIISLTTTYFFNKENFTHYFSLGDISAPATGMKIFGIKAKDSWLKTGVSLSIFISLATALFMYLQLKAIPINWQLLSSGCIWILIFSLTNSFGEEMIYRLGIVSPLKALLSPLTIYIISAILFGLPHFAGMPNGLVGAFMAGILGLVLAKSLYETNGFFWAWCIHFIQDVLILGGLFLLSAKK